MILQRYALDPLPGQELLVVEHRAEIAHVEPAFMRTEIEPCQNDGHGESGFMTRCINSAARGSRISGRYRVAKWNLQFDGDGWRSNIKTDGSGRMYLAPCGSGLGSNSGA
jgi:hypothetical protein